MATRSKAAEQLRRNRAYFQRIQNEGAYTSVFLLTGPEQFMIDQLVRRLIRSVFPSGKDDFNLLVVHAPEVRADDVVDAARTSPMFGARRVVVVHGVERYTPHEVDRIAAYAEAPSESTVLVLVGGALDGRTAGVKRLERAASVERIECTELMGDDLLRWVAVRARDVGLVLDRDVPAWLVDACGTALAPLHAALERIDLFLPTSSTPETPREVTVAVCEEVIADVRHRSGFELVAALAERDIERALACHRSLMEQGEEAIRTVALIATEFRRLLVTQDLGNATDATVASRAGVPSFRVRDYRRLARKFAAGEVRTLLQTVTQTDYALKSSRLRRDLLVDRLLLHICGSEPCRSEPASARGR
jgi:DNA polymerase-3 subunit delta